MRSRTYGRPPSTLDAMFSRSSHPAPLRTRLRRFRVWLTLVALLLWGAEPAAAQDGFLPPEQAFAFSAALSEPGVVSLRYEIAPGYYLYRERFAVSLTPDESGLGVPVLPDGLIKYDPTFEKNMEVYYGTLRIQVPVAASAQPQLLRVQGQGCADAGLCYPPMTHQVELHSADGAAMRVAAATNAPDAWRAAANASPSSLRGALTDGPSDAGLADTIAASGGWLTAGLFFLLGLLLAFTPCVLPMVPILSALVVGRQGQTAPSRSRALALAAAYVAGMSVVYTLAGVAAGLGGAGLSAWLQTPWVLGVFAALLALLALAMFDVFAFQAPAAWQTWLSARTARIPGGRMTGTALMGAASALIVGPCMAAPLAGALLYISQTGDVWLGGLALFALAWGMGAPLLAVAASAGALLPRAGHWMRSVKQFFGVLLLASAWWILMPVLASWLQMLGWAGLAALAAVVLRAFDALPADARAGRLFAKTAGLLLALASIVLVTGVASGGRDPLQPLAHLAAGGRLAASEAVQDASGSNIVFTRIRTVAELDAALARAERPVMLDFYADWCVSCKEMERFTFPYPAVADKLRQMVVLQADVTANLVEDRALLRRFRLFGPPGIVFFAPGGRLLDERVAGFQNAARFDAVLTRVLAQQ